MPCLREYRCTSCSTLLYKGLLVEGSIEVKCRKCRTMNTVVANNADKCICLVDTCPDRIAMSQTSGSPADIPSSPT